MNINTRHKSYKFLILRVCCRSPLIPVRPNYSSGDILSGSMSGSLPRSSGGSAATTGSAPNLTRVHGPGNGYRDSSPDSGTQSWANGWQQGTYSVSIFFIITEVSKINMFHSNKDKINSYVTIPCVHIGRRISFDG